MQGEGWRLGEGEGKPQPWGDSSAEPPGLHPGAPRVGAAGRTGFLAAYGTAAALEDCAGGWVTLAVSQLVLPP